MVAVIVTAAAAIFAALLWQSDEGLTPAAREVQRVADRALVTLRDGEGAQAYSLACDAIRDQHSSDEHAELWLQQPRPESWEWRTTEFSRSSSGKRQAEVVGTAVVEVEQIPWSVFLVSEDGQWRTCAFPEE